MSDPAPTSPFRHPGLDPGSSFSSAAHAEPVEGAKGLKVRTPSIQGMIFSTAMVKALQAAGRKTQTRRLLPDGRQPRLKVGDRVYVRETFRIAPDAYEGQKAGQWPHEAEPCPGWIEYAAGGSHYCFAPDYFAVLKAFGKIPVDWDNLPQRWRPSRIAPRWTSRMYLTITDVRVQQLLFISEDDCIAEGLEEDFDDDTDSHGRNVTRTSYRAADYLPWCTSPREAYADLWDQLNTKPGTRWDDNPRIAAYTFTVTRRNIDVLPVISRDTSPGYFAEPSPAHPEPVEGRALIEGNVPPHIAAQLIRARDLPQKANPQPVRKSA